MNTIKTNEINQLHNEIAELLLSNQELKQMNDELESNNSDLNEFIKFKGLEAEYIEFIESLQNLINEKAPNELAKIHWVLSICEKKIIMY